MAVARDATGAGAHSGSATSVTANHTCSGLNRVLYAAVEAYQTGNHNYPTPTAKYNGVSMTQIAQAHFGNSDNESLTLFRLTAPATGTNAVVVSNGSAIELGFVSWSVNGADQTTPETATPVVSNINNLDGNASSSSISDAVSSGDTSGMFFDAVAVYNKTVSSRGGSQTDLVDQSTGSGNDSIFTSYAAGAASLTMSETLSGAAWWGHIAFCVKAAGGAPSTRVGRGFFFQPQAWMRRASGLLIPQHTILTPERMPA